VEIGNQAVAITTDPVFIVPEYGFDRAAWFAIHILASDVVTSGLKPTYMSIDLNLPMEMNEEQLETMWQVMHQECEKLGMAVVCGHTARYENCHYPMVGGATVLAVGSKDEYVTPKLVKAGDHIIITKGPAIESSGIFAAMFPQKIKDAFGSDFADEPVLSNVCGRRCPDRGFSGCSGKRCHGHARCHRMWYLGRRL